jgi:hypothetical protein
MLHTDFKGEKKFNQKVVERFWVVEETLEDKGKELIGGKRKHDDILSDSEVEDGGEYEPPLYTGLDGSSDRQTRGANGAPPLKQSRTSPTKPSSSRITPIAEFQDLNAVSDSSSLQLWDSFFSTMIHRPIN